MIYYSAYFTARVNGEDIPARVRIYTDNSGDPEEVLLDASPVSLTWEECGITDVVHRAQMEVRVMATEDGMFRDIATQTDKVYGDLYIRQGGSMQLWWRGVYASSTFLEDFSREKNYIISLTFSDFGVLERTEYDGSLASQSGVIEVRDILETIVKVFRRTASLTDIVEHALMMTQVGDDTLSGLLVRDSILTDSDGAPRSLLDILTDMLEPTNTHIIQYGGKVHLFCPDHYLAETTADTVSLSMASGGTDATMETCEAYRRMKLEYDRTSSKMYGFSPDMSGYVFSGYYADISEEGDSSSVIAVGTKAVASGTFLAVAGGDGASASMVLMMTDGLSWPGGSKPTMPDSVGEINYQIPASVINVGMDLPFPTTAAHRIRIDMQVFAVFDRSDEDFGLYFAKVDAVVSFRGQFGSHEYLKENTSIFSPSRYSWTSEESTVSLFLQTDSPDKSRFSTLTLSLHIPDPRERGKITVEYRPRTFQFTDSKKPWGESGNEFVTSPLRALGFVGMSAEPEGYLDTSVLSGMDKVIEDLSSDGDEFSKTFAMGTPLLLSIDTFSDFFSTSGRVSEGETFLDRYGNFIRRNNVSGEGAPARRRVSGTYMFDHLAGLPVFFPDKCVPLSSMAEPGRALFIVSEQWQVRTGMSDLTIEEASVEEYDTYGDYVIAIPDTLTIDADGTAEAVVIRSSGPSWTLWAGPSVQVAPASGGPGDTQVSVSMDKNTEPEEKSSYVDIMRRSVLLSSITVRQLREEPYINSIQPSVFTLSWGEQPGPSEIDSNIDEFTVTSNNSSVTGAVTGKTLQLHIEHNAGGRESGPIAALVTVAGMKYPSVSKMVTVIVSRPFFILESIREIVIIPPEGGYADSLLFRSNCSRLEIVMVGGLHYENEVFLNMKSSRGEITLKYLTEGTNTIYISGDPGAEEMLEFEIGLTGAVSANTGSLQNAEGFSVTAYADDEQKELPLIMIQNSETYG